MHILRSQSSEHEQSALYVIKTDYHAGIGLILVGSCSELIVTVACLGGEGVKDTVKQ